MAHRLCSRVCKSVERPGLRDARKRLSASERGKRRSSEKIRGRRLHRSLQIASGLYRFPSVVAHGQGPLAKMLPPERAEEISYRLTVKNEGPKILGPCFIYWGRSSRTTDEGPTNRKLRFVGIRLVIDLGRCSRPKPWMATEDTGCGPSDQGRRAPGHQELIITRPGFAKFSNFFKAESSLSIVAESFRHNAKMMR